MSEDRADEPDPLVCCLSCGAPLDPDELAAGRDECFDCYLEAEGE